MMAFILEGRGVRFFFWGGELNEYMWIKIGMREGMG